MRPPRCVVCKKGFRGRPEEGGLLSFKLSEKDKSYNERFKQPGFVGHPRGKDWFCGKHYEKAKTYRHLTLSEAIQQLKDSDEEE